MASKNGKKDETRHLRLVPKDGHETNDAPEPDELTATDAEELFMKNVQDGYLELAIKFSEMFHDEWEGYMSKTMERGDFVRTVVEMDQEGLIHPVIAFDSSPAPTSDKPIFTPENYSLLDLAKFPAGDEDLLLWQMEAMEKSYHVIFVPNRAVQKMEKQLHELVRNIVTNSKDFPNEDYDPLPVIGYVRELVIILDNASTDYDFADEDLDDDNEDVGLDFLEDDSMSQEDRDEMFAEINDEIMKLKMNILGSEKYKIVVSV